MIVQRRSVKFDEIPIVAKSFCEKCERMESADSEAERQNYALYLRRGDAFHLVKDHPLALNASALSLFEKEGKNHSLYLAEINLFLSGTYAEAKKKKGKKDDKEAKEAVEKKIDLAIVFWDMLFRQSRYYHYLLSYEGAFDLARSVMQQVKDSKKENKDTSPKPVLSVYTRGKGEQKAKDIYPLGCFIPKNKDNKKGSALYEQRGELRISHYTIDYEKSALCIYLRWELGSLNKIVVSMFRNHSDWNGPLAHVHVLNSPSLFIGFMGCSGFVKTADWQDPYGVICQTLVD